MRSKRFSKAWLSSNFEIHHAIECGLAPRSHSADTERRPGRRLSTGILSGLLEAGWNPHQRPAPPIHWHSGLDQQVLPNMPPLAITSRRWL